MKRFSMMLLLALATMGANAQWKFGKIVKPLPPTGDDFYEPTVSVDYVAYKTNRNGTFKISYSRGGDEGNFYFTFPSSYLNCIEFTGYYIGNIQDPRDNYVNIRK